MNVERTACFPREGRRMFYDRTGRELDYSLFDTQPSFIDSREA